MALSDHEKKALIIGGSAVVIGVAVWLWRNGSLTPPGASGIQASPSIPAFPPPNYVSYNVPNAGGTPASSIYPSAMNDNGNGCCSDGCFTAQGNNTGNSPTSLEQLLNLYQTNVPDFGAKFGATINAFTAPPSTIAEQLGAPVANGTF